jgi:hypothetical protein
MEAQGYTITGLRAVRENLVTQRSPVEALDSAGVPAEHVFTITGLMGCEGELVDAALSCGSPLVTQRPPARQT